MPSWLLLPKVMTVEHPMVLLKVIRMEVQLVGSQGDYGPIVEFWVVFSKNLDFYAISTQVSDFSGLKMVNAELHARGFACL